MSKAAELRALITQVDMKKPDPAAAGALRAFFDENPGVWRIAGDFAEQANLNMIEAMQAPRSMKESLKAGLVSMAAELTLPGDGALEKLIIGQIVGCWLRLSFVEYTYGRNSAEGNFNMAQGAHWEKRLSSAQRRYLRAIESLARVRRLRLPTMQVNIGGQQVNQMR